MNRALTLFLGILVVAALVTLYFLRPHLPGTRELEQRGGHLFDFDLADVTGIRIQSGKETLEITRQGDTWTLGPKLKDRASPQAIGTLLALLQNLEVMDAIPAGEFRRSLKSSEFGLSNPKLRLTVITPTGSEEMLVGKDGVDEQQVFVRRGQSEDTYLVQDTFRSLLARPVEAFRDPRLTDLGPDRVEKVQIRRGPSEIELRRDGTNWVLQRPLRAPADSEKVDQLLGRLLGARILKFLDDPGGGSLAFELDRETQPEIRIWPEGADEPQVLRLLGPGPQIEGRPTQAALFQPRDARVYLADEPLEFCRATVDELRDTHPLRVNPDLIDRITLKAAGQSENLSRRGETDWQSTRGAQETGRTQALLGALANLRIQNFDPLADSAVPATPETIEVELDSYVSENTPETTAGTHPIARLWVGRTADGKIFARINQSPELVELTAESWNALAKSASHSAPETANPTPSPTP